MPSQEQDQLHLALSRDLVALLAPHELPLFKATSAAYRKNPEAVFANKPDKEHALGFGQTGEVAALTPAILAIVTPVIAFVAQEMGATPWRMPPADNWWLFVPVVAADRRGRTGGGGQEGADRRGRTGVGGQESARKPVRLS